MRHSVEFDTMRLIGRLVGPNASDRNAYRHYGPDAVDRLHFVRDAQGTGLTLTENSTIIELRNRGAPERRSGR